MPTPENPQSWNRYTYVLNQPTKYSDPTGHWEDEDCGSGNGNLCELPESEPPPPLPPEGDNNCKDCPDFVSVAVTIDVPTLIMLAGLGTAIVNLEVGGTIVLVGATLEACPLSGNPLCILAKFSSLGGTLTVDKYLNVYTGPQYSFGKSAITPVGFSINPGNIITDDGQPITEIESERFFRGISVSAGSIMTGGVLYSPGENRSAYYLLVPPAPEIFSANFSLQEMIYDSQRGSPIW